MADKNFKVKSGLQVPSLTTAGPVVTDSSGNVTSSSTLPISQGGTGQTTAGNALNALLPVQGGGNINKYLQTNGTNTQWNTVLQPVYAADAPADPLVGQVWIESDSTSDSFDPNIMRRKTITATAGQTTFTTDLEFIQGYEQVYFNGMLLIRTDDYTTPSNTSVVLASAAAAGDIVEILSVTNLNSINAATTTTNTFTGVQNITNNLNVGTTSPAFANRLSIKQSADNSAIGLGFRIERNSNDSSLFLGYRDNTDTWQIYASYNANGAFKPISFHTSDSERMRIASNGNVGINNTNPTATLDVNGAVTARAQVGSFNWMGDIDTAKWSSKLGGYALSFGNDGTNYTGFENWVIDGRTFRSSIQFTNTGGINIVGNYNLRSVNSTSSARKFARIDDNLTTDLANISMFGAGSNNFNGEIAFNVKSGGFYDSPLIEAMKVNVGGYVSVGGYAQDLGVGGTWGRLASRSDLNNISSGKFYSAASDFYVTVISSGVTRANNSGFQYYTAYSGAGNDTDWYVRGDGAVFSDSSSSMSTPADYAEYFEWADGNINNEDRAGYSVSLINGTQIKIAEEGEVVIGIVSANPAVVGDAAWNNWTGKYKKDEFNRYIRDENGDRILSESFDPESTYVPREERPEWSPVGMVGKLRMRKGQLVDPRWIKMRDISAEVEEWLIR